MDRNSSYFLLALPTNIQNAFALLQIPFPFLWKSSQLLSLVPCDWWWSTAHSTIDDRCLDWPPFVSFKFSRSAVVNPVFSSWRHCVDNVSLKMFWRKSVGSLSCLSCSDLTRLECSVRVNVGWVGLLVTCNFLLTRAILSNQMSANKEGGKPEWNFSQDVNATSPH